MASKSETAIRVAIFVAGLLSGSVIGALLNIFLSIENTTTLVPVRTFGPENRAFKLYMNDEILFNGTTAIVNLSTLEPDVCHDLTGYVSGSGDPAEARSALLKDTMHEDEPLPVGMKVTLYWGKACHEGKPLGIITVTPNTNKVIINRINKDTDPYYKVYNNFQKTSDGDVRILNGHTRGLRWSVPQ